MNTNDDDILGRELGKVGELGGKIGGLLASGSADSKAAGLGSSLRLEFVAKFLPTEACTEKLAFKISPEKVSSLEKPESYPVLKGQFAGLRAERIEGYFAMMDFDELEQFEV